ncbi:MULTISPECIES: hypothetical protein [Xenorhabdus]|uniref:hypothetical protein n=1 Tax=Xenorhabdus TaxID=626 RepID=UPI0006465638|nr:MULTISPECIES: hypothetical protein [Xenorhabdus]MBC8944225.1 hypothetical protein [Xenorhabdus indica]
MSSNNKSVSNEKLNNNDSTVLSNVKIKALKANVLFSNIEVCFSDSEGHYFEKHYLAYPEHDIGGVGLYFVLLLALNTPFLVSLKLTNHISPEGFRYISGVMADLMIAPSDSDPPWG